MSPKRSKGYIPTLDGWRAVAIVWVLFSHAQVWSFGRFSTNLLHETGSNGVSLFFALSGFLICTRLLREEETFGSISLRSFYTRRLFRIQPAALVYLLTVALLGAFGFIAWYGLGIAGALLMVRNVWPPSTHPGFWQTVHFWSLSVEEQFYLLLPGFLVLFRRRRLAILSLVVIALEFWHIVVRQHPSLAEFGFLIFLRTDLVLNGILLGSVFALALRKDTLCFWAKRLLHPWVAFLYVAIIVIFLGHHTALAGFAPFTTLYPIVIISTVLHPESIFGKFLELPALRFVGRISYSLYLWQQLFFYPFAPPAPGSFRSHQTLCLAGTFACALASYHLIETPFIRIGHRLARRFDRPPVTQTEPQPVPA
jgi:peptidoglycan/LPS O-acetylase OafA/YrhL